MGPFGKPGRGTRNEEQAKRAAEKSAFDLMRRRSIYCGPRRSNGRAVIFIGTLPFVLAFIYFWADMSKSAFAAKRLRAMR